MSELAARLQTALGSDYRLERELGGGGMSRVFVAEDVELGRKVVVKVLPPEMALGVNADRFRREIQLAASLQHPHIVPLLSAGHSDDLVWYTMPLIEGETLRSRVAREGELPIPEAVRLLRDVADALAYAHQHGVVHRDIKPDNVLIAGRHAVVTDFGVAKAISAAAGPASLTSVGVALGTPAYMAPEQAAASVHVDHRADVYALGAVAYELLTGRPPFVGLTAEATLAAQVTQIPEPVTRHRAAVPGAVAAMVMRCLEKKPADRWQTAVELHAQLEALATPSGGMTPTGAVPALISRLGGRRVWALLVAATAVVVVAALTYAGLRLRGGAGGSSDRSVAVLTFETLSSDTTADAYLADGLADGISTALGQLARLKVTSRTAVRRIPDAKPLAPAELGEILGAAHLVGGTVQRVAGQVRVTVELVRARSGEQLWTGRYDTTAADLLGVQARIAEAVAGSVAGRLLPSERSDVARRPTSDPRAYDHYLRGKHQLEARDPSSLPRALAEFEAALRLDSGFTDAWAAVGEAYYLALNYGWAQPGLPVESLLAKGFAATDEALRRDSGSAAAWRARGTLLHFGRPRDPEASLAALERAVALEPSDVVSREWLETVLRRFGRFEAARGALEAMLSLDPRYAEAAEDLAFMELELRRYATAIRWSDSAVALNPARWLSYCWRAQVKLASGDSGGALRDAQEGVRLGPPGSPQSLAILAMVEARAGRGREARARLEPLLRAAERLDSLWVRDGFPVALGAVAVGERDRAIRLLERVRPRGPWLWSYLILPGFDPIRRDPRFRRIIDEARPPGARDPI